jgi:hypothetical protein
MTTALYVISALMGIASIVLLVMTYRLNKDTQQIVDAYRARKLNQAGKEGDDLRSNILRVLLPSAHSSPLFWTRFASPSENYYFSLATDLLDNVSITSTNTSNAPIEASVSLDPKDTNRPKTDLRLIQAANQLAA